MKALPLLLLVLTACPDADPTPPAHDARRPAPARDEVEAQQRPSPAPAPNKNEPARPASATAMTPEKALLEARTATKALGTQLKKALLQAMGEGGPEMAIATCNEKAPVITAGLSESSSIEIRRVATRRRNPKNAPDAWEAKVIAAFERPARPGAKLEVQEHWEIVEVGGKKSLRYARSILTGEACLRCHGRDLDAALKAKIALLYPDDQATGFRKGELRGIFSARVPLP